MDETPSPSKFAAIRTRLTLVAVGLALGFAARWIGHVSSGQQTEKHFIPVEELEQKAKEEQAQKLAELREALSEKPNGGNRNSHGNAHGKAAGGKADVSKLGKSEPANSNSD